jgi:hypothetical protein
MKPTTKLHHQVFGISQSLTPLSETSKALAISKIFSKYGTTCRKTIFCLECTHSWKDQNAFIKMPKHLVCPSCNTKIEILKPRPYFTTYSYFTKVEANDNFQITRLFFVEKYLKKNQPPIYFTKEVTQHFVGLDGRITSMATRTNGFSMYYDSWVRGSDLSIMPNDFVNTNKGRLEGDYTLPKPTFLKEIVRNGFSGKYYDLAPHNLFSLLLKYPQAETLLKSGYTDFLTHFSSRQSQIKKYWNSIKICIRNNYKIQDATIWLDYVKLLEEFGKDLLSTKYVCPTDLHKAHDKLVDKKRRIQDKLDAEELAKNLKKQEREYKKAKAMYFGIQFSNGTISVKVLDSVQEFINEGKALKHCVYTNEYFKEKDSLILSARIDNKPIQTIEFSLSQMKILQARGLQNKATKYTKEIKSLVMDNIHQIQQITNLKSA